MCGDLFKGWTGLTATTYFSLVIGLALNIYLFVSLPYFSDLGISTVLINFQRTSEGLFGEMDDSPFLNLSQIRLGNWGACFIDNQTYTSFSQHGIICPTGFAAAYTIEVTITNTTVNSTITNVTDPNDNSTTTTTTNSTIVTPFSTAEIISAWATVWPELFHTFSMLGSIFSMYPYKDHIKGQMITAVALSAAAMAVDFIFYLINRSRFLSSLNASASPGPALWIDAISTFFVAVGSFSRIKDFDTKK